MPATWDTEAVPAVAAAPELETVLIFFSALFLSLPPAGAAGAEPDPEPVNVPEPE